MAFWRIDDGATVKVWYNTGATLPIDAGNGNIIITSVDIFSIPLINEADAPLFLNF